MGRYPEGAESTMEDGTKYAIGAGMSVNEATKSRDNYVLEKILQSLPDDFKGKELRILELGSGRGGMAKYISATLKSQGRLKQYIACNISRVENNYNITSAKALGLEEPQYLVRYISFDDIFAEGTITRDDRFDVVVSCEALCHSADRRAVLSNVKNLLVPGGVCFVSDVCVNADSPEEEIATCKARFSDSTFASNKEYETNF